VPHIKETEEEAAVSLAEAAVAGGETRGERVHLEVIRMEHNKEVGKAA
jgi:hypothetical protein